MGACPNCQTQVTDEFGLVVCEGCGTSLFVDMDGVPTMSEPSDQVESVEPIEPVENVDPVTPSEQEISGLQGFFAAEENVQADEHNSEEAAPPVAGPPEAAPPIEDFFTADNPEQEEYFTDEAEEVLEEDYEGASSDQPQAFEDDTVEPQQALDYAPEAEEVVEQDNVPAFEEVSDAPEFEESREEASPQYGLEDMSEISDYGNSEVSQGREGAYQLTIVISGIDSKDLRDDLYAAIEDSRFLWDEQAIINSAKNGVVKIKGVSTIKAAILLQRLRGLPLEVRWEQNAIFNVK